MFLSYTHTHTHTHIYIYIYIYILFRYSYFSLFSYRTITPERTLPPTSTINISTPISKSSKVCVQFYFFIVIIAVVLIKYVKISYRSAVIFLFPYLSPSVNSIYKIMIFFLFLIFVSSFFFQLLDFATPEARFDSAKRGTGRAQVN